MLNTLYLPDLRNMLAEGDAVGLEQFCSALHPASTAEALEGLTAEETWQVLRHADLPTRAAVFSYFPSELQVEMLSSLDRQEMGELVGELPPDERVDILQLLEEPLVEGLLAHVPPRERRDILHLQTYPEGTAGSFMTTEFARLRDDMTVAQVHDQFRQWAEHPEALETLYYLYVVDGQGHLQGVVSFRDLALNALVYGQADKRIGELIERNVISVHALDDREEVAQVLARYDLVAIPVIDDQRRLLGIVTHDDVIDVVREEATEDAQRIAGIEPLQAHYLDVGLLTLAWKRGIWLTILFFTSLFTAGALAGYDQLTNAHVWLVMFIPMIISTGGNSGNQSATLVITALSNGEVHVEHWRRVLKREVLMGLVLGTFLGLSAFLVAWGTTWRVPHAGIVAVTVVLVVLCGTLIGSALPLIFRRAGLDPALMSNPLVACLSDILGIIIYMNVALFLLSVTAQA